MDGLRFGVVKWKSTRSEDDRQCCEAGDLDFYELG